jgi:inosine-uridine nucleoside N-ribohydrolase
MSMLFIDSDNAMGASRGDVDDGFALAAAWKSGAEIAGVSSVGGNAPEPEADRNNRVLAEKCGFTGPLLRPGDLPSFFASSAPVRFLALGPLSNVASLLRETPLAPLEEVVIVGGNSRSAGRWPPFWPHEFNLTKDRAAMRVVWSSTLPLVVIPLNVASRLTVRWSDLSAIGGELGEYLRQGSRRWFRRTRLLRGSGAIRLYDAVAVLYALGAPMRTASMRARLHRNGRIEFHSGDRDIRVVTGFDRDQLWSRLLAMLSAPA